MSSEGHRVIRASEVGLYVYCTRAWWLGQVEGYRPVDQATLEAGQAAHQAHGQAVVSYHRLQQVAYVLLGLTLVVGLILLAVTMLK